MGSIILFIAPPDKALTVREQLLGTKHPGTAEIYYSIAVVYHDQGNHMNALKWYEKALPIREKILGTKHPDTVNTYYNIADIYADQEDYTKALVWYNKVLDKELTDTTPSSFVFIGIAGLCFLCILLLSRHVV